ncbi:MAG: ergothioneine biosynthesis protein EgtB [Actinomycetota bacterium]|nr:ergothioneine biosynthesis protein EgtB [Actinomycetota bacterium]
MPQAAVGLTDAEAVAALVEARQRTEALVAPVSDSDLERVHSPLMSPLVWDLAHIAAYEDLWFVHRHGDRPLLHEELTEVYDAFETPRSGRGELPLLGPRQAREYLAEVRERTLDVIAERGLGDGVIAELVLRHEHQHNETMLQTLALARLEGYEAPGPAPARTPPTTFSGLELATVPGGECTIGAERHGFAYDNERPRHRTDVRDYLIGRTPITNATYLTFVEGGGYERREWWSDEGWAWKEDYDITRPGGWTPDLRGEWLLSGLTPLHPHQPVVHISWFEADAFTRAHDLRLPTEVEWEKAATWDQELGRARPMPWGDETGVSGVHANVDQRGGGPAPAGAYPAGASPHGCLGMIGDVWEWTASDFAGYPGFEPFPYREYSEVFFGSEYRTLRGGSWATRPRVGTATFRNWDYPERRQIFAGLRVAGDVA